MYFSIATIATLVTSTLAAATIKRDDCKDYLIISTRGTFEIQGPSFSFGSMIKSTLDQVSNGEEYDTVYPAAADQNNILGVKDIINKVNDGVKNCPDQKYALLGYSQGATTTLDAIRSSKITADASNAIKAIVMVGNPYRLPNKEYNVEGFGADNAYGVLSILSKPVPTAFEQKTLDFCFSDDCICNTACTGSRTGHYNYGDNQNVQSQAADYLVKQLKN